MGNAYGGDDFQKELAKRNERMKNKRIGKIEKMSGRLDDYKAKEAATMEKLMQMAKAGRSSNSLYQG